MENAKVIEKIRKLLNMTQENGCSEDEAMTAALMAQKLMTEYDIELIDVQSENKITNEIGEEAVDTTLNGNFSTKWKSQLANTIAGNFRCKVYTNGSYIIFYGHKNDAKIAADVFKFLFHTGAKLGVKHYRQCKKEGKPTRGAATTYLLGFCKGIDEVLGKQCRALMIITSPEVEEGWKEKSTNMRTKKIHYNTSVDRNHYEKGRIDGHAAANARSIEG